MLKRTLTTTFLIFLFDLAATAQEANINLLLDGAVQPSASSTYSPAPSGFPPSAAFDGDRSGYGFGQGGFWNDDTANAFPDWIQGMFDRRMSVSRVVVYSVQDDYFSPVEPADTTVCAQYALKDFQVQVTTDGGASWQTAASVTNNNLCKRTVTFTPVRTDGIRLLVTATQDGVFTRVVELEAFPR